MGITTKTKDFWDQLSTRAKQATMIIGFFTAIGSVWALANNIFDVNIRPAWYWEYEALSKRVDHLYVIILNDELRTLKQERGRLQRNRDDRVRAGQPIPEWLTDRLTEINHQISVLEREIEKKEK